MITIGSYSETIPHNQAEMNKRRRIGNQFNINRLPDVNSSKVVF